MDDTTDPDAEVPERARGPRLFPAAYKARILAEYDTLGKAEKGALLRREGRYSSLLTEWRASGTGEPKRAWDARSVARPPIPESERSPRLKQWTERLESELGKVTEVQGRLSALLEDLATDSAQDERDETR